MQIISKFIDNSLLAENSKYKINKFQMFDKNGLRLNYQLKNILDKMKKSFVSDLEIVPLEPINLEKIQNIFINFDKTINDVSNSKFQNDIIKMDKVHSAQLVTNNGNIVLNFLSDGKKFNLIAAIIHSLNTFCHCFPYNYDKLTIDICLDDNNRNINYSELSHFTSYNEIFNILKQKSGAFNVSGVTYKNDRNIILSKTEEIIKLLFHEMIHYIGLDSQLLGVSGKMDLFISNKFNLSEAYTEFMSVLLYTAYSAIHCYGINKNINIYDYFCDFFCLETEYSLYLASNILKFYGFNNQTFRKFFTYNNKTIFCPIPIWEYVFFRAQLMLKISLLCDIIDNSWKINESNTHQIINLMKFDENFIHKLAIYMDKFEPINNISYLLIDLDWNKI